MRVVDVEYRARSILFPRCGEGTFKVHSTSIQNKRDRRLWDKPVLLTLHKRRFRCQSCGKVFTEPDPVCGARPSQYLKLVGIRHIIASPYHPQTNGKIK